MIMQIYKLHLRLMRLKIMVLTGMGPALSEMKTTQLSCQKYKSLIALVML
jgi:hypothetical protein